ncbi:DUF3549 family protein [Colwellia asteriadis]|uniref:DUF3549 family protein n=1 Tax=Colwellia asteriadis TaxID=517723 RepID=A0ABN1L5Y9_9GAMM
MSDNAQPQNIDTISQLLKLSGSQYRLYDMGRLVTKVPKELFEKVELNQVPYPTPSQGHAFIAIAFWQKQSAQPYLWLLKLPLDERGLLNQGARNHFIAIIVEALGADLTQEASKKQEDILSSNPYLFTPAQYKLASLNSKIKVDLKQPASEYLSPFLSYISGDLGWDNWQAVGVQGITDFTARIKQDNNSALLCKAFNNLPEEVLLPLCGALENESLDVNLIDIILTRLTTQLQNTAQLATQTESEEEPSQQIAQHLLRALAGSIQHKHVIEFIDSLLQQAYVSPDLLITLSGRCWSVLADNTRLMAYFEHLVSSNDIPLFTSIFKDLVAIPTIRPVVFQCMRAPNRSPALAQAIGQLFNQA